VLTVNARKAVIQTKPKVRRPGVAVAVATTDAPQPFKAFNLRTCWRKRAVALGKTGISSSTAEELKIKFNFV